jgi:nitroreductase
MLTTKEAIEQRRSIRRFKPDPVPAEHIIELIDAARLAPSGCNAQPWRFKIVNDGETRDKLAAAAYGQSFIAEAPVVIVCCADISGYIIGTVSAMQDLGKVNTVDEGIMRILLKRADQMKTMTTDQLSPEIVFNVAIAIEHMVLRALDFGLGTCWVRLIDRPKIKAMFGWNDDRYVVALLPVGYPAEFPEKRQRLEINDILFK